MSAGHMRGLPFDTEFSSGCPAGRLPRNLVTEAAIWYRSVGGRDDSSPASRTIENRLSLPGGVFDI